jgi:hypothetical protein
MSENNQPIFIELANYVTPVIAEIPGRNWVKYGEDNNYFGYLLDRYRGSPTNHAIINGISDAIVGMGLAPVGSVEDSEALLAVKKLFPNDNLRKWAFDLKTYGFYIEIAVGNAITEPKDGEQPEKRDGFELDYTPVQNWRSGKADSEGNINEWWFSDDWSQITKPQFRPKPFPVFNPKNIQETSVIVVKPYRSGSFYYPSVDYQGALQYANIEEEIANFHLNNIMNGFVPGQVINFNDGDPGEIIRNQIEAKITKKFTGSTNAGKFVLSFNKDKDSATTIEGITVSDLDKQFKFLSEEATGKIMVGHRVTSPLFFGIRDSSGLGSNADELKNAWLLYERSVLRSFRVVMLDNIERVLGYLGVNIPVDFVSLTPIEFTDKEEVEETLSKHGIDLLIGKGEYLDPKEWELIDEGDVDYELEEKLELVSTGTARPNAKSSQDAKIDETVFKVRYEYSGSPSPEREFCQKMISAGKLYRKEDIIQMGSQPVNPGWGPKGANTYSIWLYKGGGNCYHKWVRKTFMRTGGNISPGNPLAPKVSTNKAEKAGYRVRNPKQVATAPIDQPKQGFLSKYFGL